MRTAIIVTLFLSSTALVQADEPLNDDIMVNTIQCEAGRTGAKLIQLGLPANLRVAASWSHSDTTEQGGSGGGSLIVSGSGEMNKQEVKELASDGIAFNLHPGNLEVCRSVKNEIITGNLGMYECFTSKKRASLKAAIAGGQGAASCAHKVTVTKKFKGGFKAELQGFGVNAEAAQGTIYIVNVKFGAPAPAK